MSRMCWTEKPKSRSPTLQWLHAETNCDREMRVGTGAASLVLWKRSHAAAQTSRTSAYKRSAGLRQGIWHRAAISSASETEGSRKWVPEHSPVSAPRGGCPGTSQQRRGRRRHWDWAKSHAHAARQLPGSVHTGNHP